MRLVLAGMLCLLCCSAVPLVHEALGGSPSESPRFCLKTAKDELCTEQDCTKMIKETCYHGDCSDSGECVCQACWKGKSCDVPDNKHAPVFIQTFYEEYISPDEPTEYPFMYIRATDKDEAACSASATQCPCSEVLYSLNDEEEGAKSSPFLISPKTGGISVATGSHLTPDTKHRLKAYARNEADPLMQGTVSIVVIVSGVYLQDSGQTVKLRKLQVASELDSLDANSTLDITFQPAAADIGVGSLAVGSRVDCVLTIDIPEAMVVEDVKVEIFAEDQNNTLSVLCLPTVTQGGEIEITNSIIPATSYYQQEGNPFLLDAAVINLGNVSNVNSSTAASDSKIVITFSITLKEDIALGSDERYWVSAGVEYNADSKLWIGQIGFLVDQVPQYAPDTNITIDAPADYYKGEVEVFDVDLNVYKSVANLTVQATAGSTVKDYLLICELQLCNTGSGFCLDVDKDLATFQVDVASQNIYESTFAFGNIVNGGVANSTVDSRISMNVVTYLRDDSLVTAESTYDVSVSADDGTKQSENSASFTAKAARSYVTPGRTFAMNISIVDDDDDLVPGESVNVRVAIIVPYSTSVRPVTVRLGPQVSGEELQICAIRINYIGNDISCLLQRREDIENSIVYASGPVATIDLGGIANTGRESTANGVDDVIGIDFVVKSTVTDPLANNNVHTLDTTVDYHTLSWTDSITVTTITDPDLITYPAVPDDVSNPASSTFDLLEPTGSDEVAPGEYLMLAVRPVTKHGTQYRYIVSALVNTTDVTILDMRVTAVGSNIACGLLSDPTATYTSTLGGYTKDTAELDLGLVYNHAHSGSSSTQDSLVIQLAVQVKGEAVDSDLPVAVSLLVGSTRLWVAEGNITVKTSAAVEPVLPTNSTLVTATSFSTELTAGSESKLLHILVIPANTSFKYVVNYTTTAPWLQVTDVSVTSVGEQLLCTQEGVLSPTYGYSAAGMFAIVDLDYVCNVPININATDEDGKLVVEITVFASNSTEIDVGATAVFGAELEVSNAMGSKQEESYEVVFFISLPKSTFKLCCPESSLFMRPGDVEQCNVTMTILDSALSYVLELYTPFNGTASMTINDVEVEIGGFNLQYNAPDVVLTSSGNTTQNNKAVLNFGKIVNTGAHTVEAGNLADDDNNLVIQVDVQMSEGEHNDNDTSHALEAGVAVQQSVVIWVAYYKLSVLRDGAEKPTLNVSFSHNGTVAAHSLGDTVWYQVDISHATDSSAEAVDVKGHIFLPPYIQFDSMVPDYELSSIQPAMTQSNDSTGFYFTMPIMFFSDRASFSVETTIKTNYHYKLTKNWKGTTPIEVIFYMSNYDDTHYTDGQYFSEPMDYVTYDFIVPYPEIPGPIPSPTCNSPQPQGMGDRTIQDCQITASFSPDPAAAAKHARLNRGSAWKTPARAGPFLYDRWIKVDLGKRTTITGVQTQGGSNAEADGDLGKFEILYSLDDTLYKAATPSDNKVFDHQKDAPADHDTIVNHSLFTAVEARYVILNLTAYDYNGVSKWYNAIRLEILGCAIDGVTASDVCPTANTPLVTQGYDRGFLVDTVSETLFVCDTVTHGNSGVRKEIQASVYAFQWKKPDVQCFMMIYAEKQWTGMDPGLHNIIGFLPSTGRLYGIMSNSPDSYAASDTPYTSWYLIAQSDYDTASGTEGFVQSVSVPFVSMPGFTYSNPDNYASSAYTIDYWKATMSGIFRGAEKVLDWNECCQPTCAANGGPDNCS